jgi:photosystem II stability/assembly factor-like uncharacterized protein
VKGYEKCDFRSVYAFNGMTAVIANAGSPAYVLRTIDGGITWQQVYENKDTAAFIDGMDFWDGDNGVIYGDPLGGHMLLLATNDGGATWTEYPLENRPVLNDGEASFAASGSCISLSASHNITIATGGTVSRLLVSEDNAQSWETIPTPILQGESSTGIFSFFRLNKRRWLIAGGDYKQDTLRKDNLFLTTNAGKTWRAPVTTTRGYRECLVAVTRKKLLAAGPGGIDISFDKGRNWQPLSDEKQFHVVKKGRQGKLIIIAGGGGKLSVLRYTK